MYSEAYKEVSDMQIVSNYSKQATEWLFSWGTQTTKEGVQGQCSSEDLLEPGGTGAM